MPPKHYTDGTYEPLKVIQAWDLNFALGNVVKYISRAGKKGPALDDLVKARDYLDREIDRLANAVLAKVPVEETEFYKWVTTPWDKRPGEPPPEKGPQCGCSSRGPCYTHR